MAQYDGALAQQYNSAARLSHPLNQMTYGTWLHELGAIKGTEVLDLACGGGHSSRLLAKCRAKVTGVDISEDQIAIAQQQESAAPMGIVYLAQNVLGLDLGRQFDFVAPSFLFHYASSVAELLGFIEAAARHTKKGGRMVALNTPPDPIVPRMQNGSHYTEWVDAPYKEGSRVCLHLLDAEGEEVCSFQYYFWSKETYESLLWASGFSNIRWVKHRVPETLKSVYDNWQELEKYNASLVLAADKT